MMKIIGRAILGLFLIAAVVGCSSFDGRKQVERFDESMALFHKAAVQESAYNELGYTPLSSDGQTISIDGSEERLLFAHGPSFYSGHRLPQQEPPARYRLSIISELGPGDFIPASLLFYPYVTALDGDYEMIESVPLEAERYKTKFWGGSGVLWLYDIPDRTEFIIFHTSEEVFGKTYPVPGASSGSMAGNIFVSTEGGTFQVPFAATGTLFVEIETEQP